MIMIATRFFFNDTATTEIYTLSLHDALPISRCCPAHAAPPIVSVSATNASEDWFMRLVRFGGLVWSELYTGRDRKSTRLNSSHANISYAVFCLKKKKICLFLIEKI